MGQARRRGTFEQRKEAAVERKRQTEERLLKIRMEKKNETPEQRRARIAAELHLAQLLSRKF